jgi:RNA polymerase sigma-70 factor (ECF subfamily)
MDLLKGEFLELFDEHHAALFRFAYRLTGSVPDAEDIVQECFLGLLRPTSSYDPARASLRTYLFGAVRNQSLKRSRRPDAPSQSPTHGPSPENEVLRTEVAETVTHAVMQLPDAQREVLILAHYEQMPLGEIAQVMISNWAP